MRRVMMKTGLLAGLLALLMACSTTVERQVDRYKRAADKIEVLMAKKPMMRTAVEAKLKGFKAEHDKIIAGTDEEAKKKALARLSSRMEEYVKQIDPSMAPKAKSTAAKGKLGAPAGKTVTSAKLGAPAAKTVTSAKLGAPAAKPLVKPTAPAGKLGAPKGQLGAPAGKLGAPAGKLGAPAGKLGAPAGKLGAPAGKLGAPAGKLGTPGKLGTTPASAR